MRLLLITQKLLILTLLLFSTEVICQSKNELITGNWLLDYDKTLEGSDSDAKTALNHITESHRAEIEKVFRNRQLFFANDQSFTIQLADRRKSLGYWEVDTTEEILIIKNKAGDNERSFKIHVLTYDTLVLEEVNTKGKGYFEKLHFTKLN